MEKQSGKDENKYIEISNNKWERIYLSADEFKKDFESLFNDYKAIYQDARIKDFANDCIHQYKTYLSNVRFIDDYKTGINDVESVVKGENIVEEIQIYINNKRVYQGTIVSRMSENYEPDKHEIDHTKRKGLKITFSVIIDYLESIGSEYNTQSIHNHINNTKNDFKIKPSIDQDIDEVRRIIKPLSGYWNKNKIMEDFEFKTFENCIYSIIKYGALPDERIKIQNTKAPAVFIRRTVYEVYRYLGKKYRNELIDIIHLFKQFDNTEKRTSNSKFSAYDGNYENDINTMITIK